MKDSELLDHVIEQFQLLPFNLFRDYFSTKIVKKKWHAPDHICDALQNIGSMSYFQSGFFGRGKK